MPAAGLHNWPQAIFIPEPVSWQIVKFFGSSYYCKTNLMKLRLTAYWRLHSIPILLAGTCIAFYYIFAGLLERSDSVQLLALYAALFFLCFKLIQFEKWNFRFLLICGLLFRLAFLCSWPNLSQDFYRFIWDGRLLLAGINPYRYTPDELITMAHPVLSQLNGLYEGMGALSAGHYSNYPPLHQLLFAMAVFLGGKGITGPLLVFRCINLLADLGILIIGRKLLIKLNLSPHLIFWYFLNPLVIIELSGNVHFEGVMCFFFIWALYLTFFSRWYWAAIVYALSVVTKLVPLIFLPLFFSYYGFGKSMRFYALTLLASLAFILPFLAPGAIDHYGETLGLWFSNFEFNAGIYNLIKEAGRLFHIRPWELIKNYGKVFPVFTLGILIVFTLFRRNQRPKVFLGSMMWVLAMYYLLSPTVHPWYILPLVLLCAFTEFRFPLFWSAVIMLSYTAYAQPETSEILSLLAVEYIVVIGMMLYEIYRQREDFFSIRKN